MKIEPRTLKVIKNYLLKKHTPVLDFESGSIWVPSRPQDGSDFVVSFRIPEMGNGETIAVCPDCIQSEIELEEDYVKCSNGAQFPRSEYGLECVTPEQTNRAHMFVHAACKGIGELNGETIWQQVTESKERAASAIAARLFKTTKTEEREWITSWYHYGVRVCCMKVNVPLGIRIIMWL